MAVVLYLTLLKLPFVACFAGAHPGGVSAAAAVAAGRDVLDRAGPARPRHDCQLPSAGLYIAGDVVGLLARAIGGTVQAAADHPDGRSAGLGGHGRHDALGYFKAMRTVTTTYRLQTTKPLPGGKLRVLQISDLHPAKVPWTASASRLNRRIRG